MSRWVLALADLRQGTGRSVPVARAETKEQLIRFLELEECDAYTEQVRVLGSLPDVAGTVEVVKEYRKGGPLEWYAPPHTTMAPYFMEVGTKDEYVAKVISDRRDWYDRSITPLPDVSSGLVLPPKLAIVR